MNERLIKKCPHCGRSFPCCQDEISQCDCYPIVVGDETREKLLRQYGDCLCVACLQEMQRENKQDG